jgi:hypothetical protein
MSLTGCRFILPLLGEFIDSGFRTPKDSLIYSLKSNARYQSIVLGCGTVGLVYVFWQHGFEASSVKSLVMALAYCWGLIQAIYLMGHGLVAVPRKLFRNSSVGGRLRCLQARAPKVHDKLEDAGTELDELEQQVEQLRQRKNGISRDHQMWVDDLVEMRSLHSARQLATPGVSGAVIPAILTDQYLADLTRRLKRARHKQLRFVDAWRRLVRDAAHAQAILDAAASKRLDFGRASPTASFLDRITVLTPYTRYMIYAKIGPASRIPLGILFGFASICIIWSELIKAAAPQLSIISLTVVRYSGDSGAVRFGGQLAASFWLLYMCTTALASFDDVKVWGNRALVRRNTYGESACWYAGQIAKLTVPLAYNFVTFLPPSIYKETTFHHFLGRLIVLTPLGQGFDYFFPIFILLPVCATLFNLYGKVKGVFGYGIVNDEDEDDPTGFGTGDWREGRDLIARELQGRPSLDSSTPLDGARSSGSGPSRSSRQGERAGPVLERSDRAAPTLHIPPAPGAENSRRHAQRPSAAAQEADSEDESVLAGFAHRVRNTIDSVETPAWLSGLGKRPKWMGRVDGNAEATGRADAGRGLGRWFGGRPADGRVRL